MSYKGLAEEADWHHEAWLDGRKVLMERMYDTHREDEGRKHVASDTTLPAIDTLRRGLRMCMHLVSPRIFFVLVTFSASDAICASDERDSYHAK